MKERGKRENIEGGKGGGGRREERGREGGGKMKEHTDIDDPEEGEGPHRFVQIEQ
jgi:hypothetical protein